MAPPNHITKTGQEPKPSPVAAIVSLRARLLARNVSLPPALFASLLPDICKPQQLIIIIFFDIISDPKKC
jgi:hypothetical protein